MSEELVTKQVDGGIAVVTLNRPERHNAWSPQLEAVYVAHLHDAAADPEVRVIVVTGAGRSFCPGMDTATLAASADQGISTEPHKRPPMTTPRSIRKPIIAAVNGACAGIGLVVALNCDLRFASTTAKFTTAFAHRGIMAEQGMAWSLPRVVGTPNALDLLFSARVVQGQEALDLGLVNRLWEPEELMPRTLDYARGLVERSSPMAMGVAKDQVYRAEESGLEEARTLALRYWYDPFQDHGDFKEGVHSYLEKRLPDFAPWDPGTTTDPRPLPPV